MALKAHTKREQSTSFKAADHIGRLVAITVNAVENVETKFGEKTAIKADVTICDGISAGADYGDSMIFSAGLVNDLKDCEPGETVVGRINELALKNDMSTYVLDVPTADDFAAAQAFFPEF